jgi:hypothetical protein
MEKKNDGTLLLLLAAGFGIYWLTRKKTAANILPVVPPIDTHPPKDSTPDIDPVDDFDKHKFVQDPLQDNYPVIDQPIYNNTVADIVSIISQPSYDYVGVKETVYNEQTQYNNNTTVTDMLTNVWLPNYDNKTVIDPVLNENLLPIE